jgi:hypothetical protein
MRETYPPVLLSRKARSLQKQGNEKIAGPTRESLVTLLFTSISRPIKMLIILPIVLSLSLYITFVYGVYYIFLTSIDQTFREVYGFTERTVGLPYLGLGIGACSGMLISGYASDRIMKRLTRNGEIKPEYRLPPLIPGSLFTPIGLFWFGWSIVGHVHWIMPVIGMVWIGIGIAAAFVSDSAQRFA